MDYWYHVFRPSFTQLLSLSLVRPTSIQSSRMQFSPSRMKLAQKRAKSIASFFWVGKLLRKRESEYFCDSSNSGLLKFLISRRRTPGRIFVMTLTNTSFYHSIHSNIQKLLFNLHLTHRQRVAHRRERWTTFCNPRLVICTTDKWHCTMLSS